MQHCDYTVIGGEMSDKEIQSIIDHGREKNKNLTLRSVTIRLDGDDYADVEYEFDTPKFDRIRRITGYLVGTLDRFNDAKRAEVTDRVTHTLEDDMEDVYV